MAKLSIENAIYDISGLREKIVRILSERNYMEIRGDHIVRVPRIPGRIFERDNGYGHILIDLIYQRWYDPEAKQSRNRRATIGETLDICPMAMIPTERYTEFFDLETGELLRPFDDEEEPQKEKPAPKGGGKKKTETKKQEKEPKLPTSESSSTEEPKETTDPSITRAEEQNKPDNAPEDKEDKYKQGYEDMVESLISTRRHFADEERMGDERKEEEELEQELYADEPPETEEEMDDEENELRALFGLEPKPRAPKTPEELEFEREWAKYQKARERMAILRQILTGMLTSIRNQAKRHPDDIVNEYKVRKINSVLSEIREKYRNSEYYDLLDLMEEPKIVKDEDGDLTVTGMTYSDAEVLLGNYETVFKFIQVNKKPKRKKLENLRT